MSNFLMRREDEYNHAPDPVPNFNESVYSNGFDFRQRVGGWMRLGNRVNEGRAELSVCLYLPDGRVACQFQRPRIEHNNAFDAGGLSYEVIEPFKSIRMQYEGDLLIVDNPDDLREPQRLFAEGPRLPGRVDFTHVASSPIHGGEPTDDVTPTMYGRDFSRGHFNQHGKVDGVIEVGAERWQIDGRGWRDHSWGPRYWQAIYYYRLFIANFEDGDGFMLLRITDEAGKTRRLGVLLVDGEYEEVTDLNVITDWTDKHDPHRVRLSVATDKRKALIDAEVLTLAPLRNRRQVDGETLISRIAEGYSKFTWDGREGFGMTEYIERVEDGQMVGYPL
ncbi:hypothetical protein SAMN04490248_12612 [Salinihabitans flavidus]|uniref:Hydroxyneurosporene synthase (CrtC) n=1 Tax=Salinihabitans flavidus TaxID=569882 RepID=A0A1H8V7B4_9RHOB|nr:hypothetical protein [Salinihabitans flavidus]SEP11362.1 hypothetical protein SAMN04490248_12612 [Salinihabitans flavidus]